MIKGWVRESFQPAYRKTVDKALNEAQNFFKHAHRDADAVLDYDPERADFLLLDACWPYKRLTREVLPLMGTFESRAVLTWAREWATYEGMEETISASERGRWARLSRREFFQQMLPLAYKMESKPRAAPQSSEDVR